MKHKLIVVLSISLAVSIACNIYQGINAHRKNAVNATLSEEHLKMMETITDLREELSIKNHCV